MKYGKDLISRNESSSAHGRATNGTGRYLYVNMVDRVKFRLSLIEKIVTDRRQGELTVDS